MAITQQDIDTIDRAIAMGESIVRFADRTVQYRSINELIKAKAVMQDELAQATNPGRKRFFRLFHAGKGF